MNNLIPRPFPAAIVCLFTTLLAIPVVALPPGGRSLYFVHNNANGNGNGNATTYWKPDPEFTVEGAEDSETLTFISGFAYALSYSAEEWY